ncbi:heme ABC exporter ATP-binding protein CcmA [Fulvimarina sp. 2208YS6-2-32]|uniref:heme ABC exporter ATP-binding protein CcmA n=1 Tax=Fulvimarina uroteuthidis TaxID=3098149 RepID=UPI003A0FBC8C
MTIAADGLLVGRGRAIAAGPLDFALAAGEGLVVTGPNGSGKSTMLRTLAGLLPALGGTIAVSGGLAGDGEPVGSIAEIAHYVGHRNAMKPGISVGRNLDFWRATLDLAGTPVPNEAALLALGLPDLTAVPFGYLSAGQQRRSSLARLLVAPRDIWILDEPTAALDAESQALFGRLMQRHLETGGLIIAATHQPLGLEHARRLDLSRSDLRESRPAGPGVNVSDDELVEAEGWL